MSRTDELRRDGATERGSGGGGAPFVKWGDSYAYIEGKVVNIWEGKYGPTATFVVTGHSPGLIASGKSEDGDRYSKEVEVGEQVNVGLNHASLKNTLGSEDVGEGFHVAFEGWGDTKGGQKFRIFAVIEAPAAAQKVGTTQNGNAPPWDGDDIPPPDDDDVPF